MKMEWEIYQDKAYYDLWAVRPVQERFFDSKLLFHFIKREDAEAFKALLAIAL